VFGFLRSKSRRKKTFDRYLSAFGFPPASLPDTVKDELLRLIAEEEAFMNKWRINRAPTTAGTPPEEMLMKFSAALIAFKCMPEDFAGQHPTWVETVGSLVSRSATDPGGIDAKIIALLNRHGLAAPRTTA
jgi:hypothetical protein